MDVARRDRVAAKAAILASLAGVSLSDHRRRMLRRFVDAYLPLRTYEIHQLETELAVLLPNLKEAQMTDFLTFPEVIGQRKMMTQLLTKRFGTLSLEIQTHLADLSPDQLSALTDEIFGMQHLADLEAWLERNPPAGWENPIPEEFLDDDEHGADSADEG